MYGACQLVLAIVGARDNDRSQAQRSGTERPVGTRPLPHARQVRIPVKDDGATVGGQYGY